MELSIFLVLKRVSCVDIKIRESNISEFWNSRYESFKFGMVSAMEEVDLKRKEVRERLVVLWWRAKGRGKKR